MNTDSLMSNLRQLITALATYEATKHGLDGDMAVAAATGAIAIANFAWSVYSHWNMVKAPAK